MPAEHAAWIAEGLVEASLRGIDTHGVRLFPTYLSELDGGRATAVPEVVWLGDRPAAVLLDAGGALGLVAGKLAVEEVAVRARRHGVAAVAVRNSNHFGPASRYTLPLARQGLLGLAFSNSDALVAPFGGIKPFFGTNPLSFAAMAEEGELLAIDMATSQVAYSKIRQRRAEGAALDVGWAVDDTGADAAETGGQVSALKPLGGYKGECLGLMVEVLVALLVGEKFDHELSHLFDPPFDEPRHVSHLFLAIDPAAFGDPAAFRARLTRLLGLIRAEPSAPGERILVPGDLEAESMRERTARGIPLDERELSAFRRIDAEDDEPTSI